MINQIFEPDQTQLSTVNRILIGQYAFEDYQVYELDELTIYFLILTDPDGNHHIGSSMDGRLEAVEDAQAQCCAASNYDVDIFHLNKVAEYVSICGAISYEEQCL